MEIVFATSNQHKLQEASDILEPFATLVIPAQLGIHEEIPEEGETLEQNALYKANYIYGKTGKNCFADDTGLEAEALGGAPGVYSARYAGAECNAAANMHKLLNELKGHANQKARFRTVVALVLDGKSYFFEGVLNGSITQNAKGSNGFGYDPVFVPQGYTKTLAELSAREKNLISHRGFAMRKLAGFLKDKL
ncbi:MAG: RdgB/HAM1 family non-canonical purine NTP pyrophosphatase [Bacteroidia bacterium]|nr:RdgB/HAM1 family non-canonical purine NTP pyrophosphatase [Bacteroidia bacterium]